MTTPQFALSHALIAHQPRYYGEPGYWPEAVGKIAEDVLTSLRANGWALVPLIDFPDQTCPGCQLEHPGTDCQQPDLFEESA